MVARWAARQVCFGNPRLVRVRVRAANLKGLTVKQLREMCDEKGIEHRGLKVKSEVVRALSEN